MNNQSNVITMRDGVFTSIDYPGSAYTGVWSINDNGQIVGRYQTSGHHHRFPGRAWNACLWNQ